MHITLSGPDARSPCIIFLRGGPAFMCTYIVLEVLPPLPHPPVPSSSFAASFQHILCCEGANLTKHISHGGSFNPLLAFIGIRVPCLAHSGH